MEREQKSYKFIHECLHCGSKEYSYHRVGGRRDYYGWHIVGGHTVMVYAGPRPDVDSAWVQTMGTHTLRWYPGPYKFWFQVECLMSHTHRDPSEQEKYVQEVKWIKTIWEEGHGFQFPEEENEEEEDLEASLNRRREYGEESSSSGNQ